jgi:hypothetical protein
MVTLTPMTRITELGGRVVGLFIRRRILLAYRFALSHPIQYVVLHR